MKSKMTFCSRFTPALLICLLVAGCSNKDAELATQRQKELEAVRAELAEAKASIAAKEDELTRLRKDTAELLRLRNEIRQLRDDKKQLSQQAQNAQAQAQQAQAQVQVIQSQAQQAAQAMAAQQQAIAAQNRQNEYEARIKAMVDASGGMTTPQGQATATCLNNLRQIDGAKQQWALQNKKNTGAVPTATDIAPYLKAKALPKCPAGGTYSLNSVGVVPTCTIPGHALPQ